MDNKELACLFTGYGYQARFVEDLANIDLDLATSLEWAYKQIRHIQKAARSGAPLFKPRWPVLIMRTPKGWGAPRKVHGELVEGSFRSHQVPLPGAKTDAEELRLLQEWLKSYSPSEIFDSDGNISANIEKSFPVSSRRLGQSQVSNPCRQPLKLRTWHQFAVPKGSIRSCLKVIGEFLAAAICDNPDSLRIFSPDELVSNKLDAVFRYTGRNFQWDQYSCARGGKVVEILSEHTCQGNLISLHSKRLLINDRLPPGLHDDRSDWSLPHLRELLANCVDYDGPILEIPQSCPSPQLAERSQQYYLYLHKCVDSARA